MDLFNNFLTNLKMDIKTIANVKTTFTVVKELDWATIIKKDRSGKNWCVFKCEGGYNFCTPWPNF